MSAVEDLRVYNKALELIVLVYKLIKYNPQLLKDYSLCDQIKRASVSVAANISEGYCRSAKQYIYFLGVASGSSNEMSTLLTIVQLIYNIDTVKLQQEYRSLGKQIIAFSKSMNSNKL